VASISLDKANFLALILETLLYGVFCVLFVASISVIVRRRGASVNSRLLVTISVIWILSTLHWILDVIRGVQAFVELERGGALQYFLDLSNPLQAAKTAVYVTLTLVGDGFLIFRCFMVWGARWYMIIVPAMLLCGTGVGGYGATYEFSKAAPGAEVFLPAIVPWITSFISLTLCTNVVCTCLIAIRILRIGNGVRNTVATQNLSLNALTVLAESAALYSGSVLSLMITYLLDSNAQYTVLDLTAPLIGITFSIIVIRVSLVAHPSRSYSSHIGAGSRNVGATADGYAMHRRPAVAVNVSHLVEIDHGDSASDQYQKHEAV